MNIKPQTAGRPPIRSPQVIAWLMTRLIVCLSFAHGLVGCETDLDPISEPPVINPPPLTPPPPTQFVPLEALHGFFYGSMTEGENTRYAEALLTVDGLVRIYIGSQSGDGFDPVGSMQFVGLLETAGVPAFGTGMIIGQYCALEPGPFCNGPVSGEIGIFVATRSQLSGYVRVTTSDGDETWVFDMSWPTHSYLDRATMAYVAGQYREELAEFAHGDNVTINIDGAGEMFFQSAETGCIGNGSLAPYLDGEFNVYSVTLTIDSCDGVYAYLNGEFEGLATRSWDDWSSWGDWLQVWLTSPDGASSPAAITMWGANLAPPWDYW